MNVTRLLLKRHHRLGALVAVALVLLLLTLPIAQGLTFGSPIRISTNTYVSGAPSAAASGNYVYVAWVDDTPVTGSGGSYEIWMRASSNYGASFGSAIRLTTNTGMSWNPSVAAVGSYVYIAWQDDTPVSGSGSESEIWMRVSSNNGGAFGSAIRMSTNTGRSENPSVAAGGSYVYVAWEDSTPVSGGSLEIWMRVSSNNGANFGPAIRITTNTGWSENPSVAATLSYVYVTWDDWTPATGSGNKNEIWMRVSANNGASFGSPIRISYNQYQSFDPSVAASGSSVYVAWYDNTPVSGSGGSYEIWTRVSSNNGASFGSAIRMTTNTGRSGSPSVAANGVNVYVAWDDDTPVPGGGACGPYGCPYEIWMRASPNNGASFGSTIRISTNIGWSNGPSVAAWGNYVYVAWQDDTPVTGSGACEYGPPFCPPEVWMRVRSG